MSAASTDEHTRKVGVWTVRRVYRPARRGENADEHGRVCTATLTHPGGMRFELPATHQSDHECISFALSLMPKY